MSYYIRLVQRVGEYLSGLFQPSKTPLLLEPPSSVIIPQLLSSVNLLSGLDNQSDVCPLVNSTSLNLNNEVPWWFLLSLYLPLMFILLHAMFGVGVQ